MSIELATAYVNIVSSTGGLGKGLTTELGAAGGVAGATAGKKFNNKMGGALALASKGGGMLTKSLTLPLIAVGAMAVKSADHVGDAMDAIKIATGATGKKLAGLQGIAKGIAGKIPVDIDTVSAAIGSLNTATGATGPVLQGMTTKVLEASRVLGEDGAANAKSFGDALNQANIPAKDSDKVLNAMFASSQKYGTSLGGMMGNLKKFGPQMSSAGLSMTDTIDLFGQFNKAGVSANRIVPSLNAAFLKWSKAGKDPQKMLAGLSKKIKGAKTDQEAMSIASQDFSGPGASAFVTALRKGGVSLDDLGGSLGAASVDILKTGKNTRTLGEKMSLMKNKAMLAMVPLGNAIIPILTKALGVLSSVVSGAVSWWSGLSGTMKTIIKVILGIVAAVGPMLLIFVKLVSFGKKLATAITIVKTAMAKLNLTFLANPIFLIVAAIVALVAIFVVLWNKSEAFRNFWKAIWDGIKLAVGAVVGWFKDTVVPAFQAAWELIKAPLQIFWDFVQMAWGAIKKIFSGFIEFFKGVFTGNWTLAWDGIKQIFQGIWDFLKGALQAIKDMFSVVWGAIKSALDATWGAIKSAAKAAWNLVKKYIVDPMIEGFATINGWISDVKGALSTAWGGIKSAAKAAWNLVKGYIVDPVKTAWKAISGVIGDIKSGLSTAWGKIKSTAKSAWNMVHDYVIDPLKKAYNWVVDTFGKIGTVISGAFDKVGDFLKKPINAVISGINWVIRQLNKISFHVPSWVPGIGGKGFGINISEIPPLAKGGIADAMKPYLVGERGPELFIPRRTGRVVSNNNLGQGNTTINVTVDMSDLAQLKTLEDFLGMLRVRTRMGAGS